jgi:hypothetical protein
MYFFLHEALAESYPDRILDIQKQQMRRLRIAKNPPEKQ